MTRPATLPDAAVQFALEPGSWTDVIAIVVGLLALFGITGIAWIFSKKARARSALNRLGIEVSDDSLVRRIDDRDDRAVVLLLRAGIRPDVPIGGRTPIQAALATRNETALRTLLDNGHAAEVAATLVQEAGPPWQASSGGPPGGEVLAGVQEVVDHLQRLIATELDPEERTEMLNLGLDLEVVQTFLLYRLIFRKNFRNLSYRGLLVDTDAELIGPIIDGGSSIHSGTAAAVVEKVNNQIAENETLLEQRNISIEIRSYDLPPTVHGFLIGDSHLYLGFTEFSHGKLHGGEFAYYYLRHRKSDEMTAHLFRMYRSWFAYYWNRGTVLCGA
ncbi:hypothetical protein [Amycolatopsis aidingensis]|uniref:hypothetical protein n=1 Tax=Amycolatopsis aidingensis TaxID=2842453 RepID=UPI001C0CC6BB|nr:hypothetical protein [Amycolatopsis aidingensis]